MKEDKLKCPECGKVFEYGDTIMRDEKGDDCCNMCSYKDGKINYVPLEKIK